ARPEVGTLRGCTLCSPGRPSSSVAATFQRTEPSLPVGEQVSDDQDAQPQRDARDTDDGVEASQKEEDVGEGEPPFDLLQLGRGRRLQGEGVILCHGLVTVRHGVVPFWLMPCFVACPETAPARPYRATEQWPSPSLQDTVCLARRVFPEPPTGPHLACQKKKGRRPARREGEATGGTRAGRVAWKGAGTTNP